MRLICAGQGIGSTFFGSGSGPTGATSRKVLIRVSFGVNGDSDAPPNPRLKVGVLVSEVVGKGFEVFRLASASRVPGVSCVVEVGLALEEGFGPKMDMGDRT
jgi:hypothetical protein